MPGQRFTWYNGIGLLLALIFALFPVLWMLSTSFKPSDEWVKVPAVWVSGKPTIDNYLTVLAPEVLLEERGGLGQYDEEGNLLERDAGSGYAGGAMADFLTKSAWQSIYGSLILASGGTALSIIVSLMAALAIARYRFGGNFTPFFILSARMFPPAAIAVPFVIMFSDVGASDTYWGLILVYAAVTVPFATWMLKSFIDDLPHEIEEAAMMDGMSRWKAHLLVTVPLIKGGLVATTLFIFILNWSEFLFALVLTYNKVSSIPVQMAKYFSATEGLLYGAQAALATVSIIPLVIIGFLIQKHLVRGLTLGAIKR